MALQNTKSRQTACQKHADPADLESLTSQEAALPAHPSLGQVKLDGEDIKEAKTALCGCWKADSLSILAPANPSFPCLSEPEEYVPLPVRFLFSCQEATQTLSLL